MKALIFAAGLGKRMRPLTNHTPKPLLEVGGRALIVHHLEKLAQCGVRDVVVNTSWLAEQFPAALGDGSRWGLRIVYSYEGGIPLETGGGMLNALPLLGDEPFMLVNGDVWTDYDLARLREPVGVAHLVMVDVPPQATAGDFALDAQGVLHPAGEPMLTYSGVGVFRPQIFANWRDSVEDSAKTRASRPRFQLAPILRAQMAYRAVTGEYHAGAWTDVGTPERLRQLQTG
jgi:MurNAc alpha-1-phosphate uridylyltransferase